MYYYAYEFAPVKIIYADSEGAQAAQKASKTTTDREKKHHQKVHEMVQDAVDLEAGSKSNEQIFSCSADVEENMNKVFELFDNHQKILVNLQNAIHILIL